MHADQRRNPVSEIARTELFFEGRENGQVPLEVMRARGMRIPDDDAELDDAGLHATLWQIVRTMAEMGMLLESTNHLSDRELYRYLVGKCLREETLLDGAGFWHISPIGGFSEEDVDVYLRYYADDETRADWDPEVEVPPKERPPYDRDRFLPGGSEAEPWREQ